METKGKERKGKEGWSRWSGQARGPGIHVVALVVAIAGLAPGTAWAQVDLSGESVSVCDPTSPVLVSGTVGLAGGTEGAEYEFNVDYVVAEDDSLLETIERHLLRIVILRYNNWPCQKTAPVCDPAAIDACRADCIYKGVRWAAIPICLPSGVDECRVRFLCMMPRKSIPPPGDGPGWTSRIDVDPDNLISESDEGNNTAALQFTTPEECQPIGACCASLVCAEITQAECEANLGDYRGDDTTCDVGCLDQVPTISEWALVVLTLLLLSAGTIVFARRRARAASA